MRFQGLLKSGKPALTERLSLMQQVNRLMEEATQAGLPTATDCLDATFARVKLSAGKFTVSGAVTLTAGCAEHAEQKSPGAVRLSAGCASYAMFDVDSIVEAILWTKCFLQVLGDGECEIHPLCAA